MKISALPAITTSPEETFLRGKDVATELTRGSCIALCGTLGSGKTCFAHGIIAALTDVTTQFQGSPTFALVHEYSQRTTFDRLLHVDFYRIKNKEELYGIGWDDYLAGDSISLIEWANLFPELLPPDALWISFSVLPDAPEKRSIEQHTVQK
jgi:tRNA threonylcarbamoyladenosine biosynthesis protein TsaE